MDQPFRTSTRIHREKARAAFTALAPGEDIDLADAKAPGTWQQYRSAWNVYGAWCEEEGREPMPASPDQLRAYVKHLAVGGRVASTIEAHVAAIATVHRLNGHAVDRTLIVEHLKANRRRGRPPRRARPLRIADVQDMLVRLDQSAPRDMRDAVLLLIGSAGALRSAELVGLDFTRPGLEASGGSGFVSIERDGLLVTLLRSKASQVTPQEIPLPFSEVPPLRGWFDRWTEGASIQPGEPIFRPIASTGSIVAARLAPGAVTSILKARAMDLAMSRGMSELEAINWANRVTGHALRRGYATSAAEAGLSLGAIRKRTRHADDATLTKYVDAAEGWKTTGLEGLWGEGKR